VRGSLRAFGTLLVVVGLGVLGWAVLVWQWEDPFTSVYTALEQRGLESEYERERKRFRPAPRTRVSPRAPTLTDRRRTLAQEARRYARRVEPGAAIGRIVVPRLGVNMLMVNGTDSATLKRGPGRYLGSAMPGAGELVYIAGHRTTYAAPFSRIETLRTGDRVTIEVPYGRFEYRVVGHTVVPATALRVLRSRGREEIALQACHPRFFATERYIAYARPVSVLPRGGSAFTLAEGNAPVPPAGPPSLQSAVPEQRLALPPGQAGLRPRHSAL